MLRITPDITTRELTLTDASSLAQLLNHATSDLPYCRAFDTGSVRSEVLSEPSIPKAENFAEWHSRMCMGAWKAGRLIGFIDSAVVKITESPIPVGSVDTGILPQQHSPYDRFSALIRCLILPKEPSLATEVHGALLEPLEKRWQAGRIERIDAFLPALGYQRLQAGNGILPGEWREHFRLLTESGYQLAHRYRAMTMQINNFVEEVYPTVSIGLETRHTDFGWTSQLYHRRITPIGAIRLIGSNLALEPTKQNKPRSLDDALAPVAVIHSLKVDDEWRENNLGKLLLRRAINDCNHQGYRQMLIYLRQDNHAGWSLLAQHGFEELDYRGYTFRKQLVHDTA